VLLAVFVHTAGVAMAGCVVLVPHAVALVVVRCPMLTAAMADVAEIGRQATMDVRPTVLAT